MPEVTLLGQVTLIFHMDMHYEDFFNYMITYYFSYKTFSSFISQNIW